MSLFNLGIISDFESNPRKYGCSYKSKYLSIEIISRLEGRTLKFSDSDLFKLEIPPGAIRGESQLVYMHLDKPPKSDGHHGKVSYSPVVDCGPDGLEFSVSCKAGIFLINKK